MLMRIQDRKMEEELAEAKAEVSVFDFDEPEQRAIIFLWSGCFQYPGGSAVGFGGLSKGAAGNGRWVIVQNRVRNPRNVFSSVDRRHRVLKRVVGKCNGALPKWLVFSGCLVFYCLNSEEVPSDV